VPKFKIEWAEGRAHKPKWKETIVEAETAEETERSFIRGRPYHTTGRCSSGITYGPSVTKIKE
jgi:hypothetical protein